MRPPNLAGHVVAAADGTHDALVGVVVEVAATLDDGALVAAVWLRREDVDEVEWNR